MTLKKHSLNELQKSFLEDENMFEGKASGGDAEQ